MENFYCMFTYLCVLANFICSVCVSPALCLIYLANNGAWFSLILVALWKFYVGFNDFEIRSLGLFQAYSIVTWKPNNYLGNQDNIKGDSKWGARNLGSECDEETK